MESLPLLPAGKIDLDALPALGESDGAHRFGPVAPRDLVEMKLAEIWSDALDAHNMGVYDNFFEIGGHSVLAVRLMAAIQKDFGRELPMAAFIQRPTIKQQVALLRRNEDTEAWTSLPAWKKAPGGGQP